MEVIHKDGVIYLHQAKYGMELLLRFHLSEAKASSTLVTPGSKLSKDSRELLDDNMLYRKMVGCLQYLTMTCPEICYAIN